MESLVPGCTYVSQFDEEDPEYEYEYETSYVTMDLGVIDPTIVPNTSNYRLIGLDTPTPYFQVPGVMTWKGRYQRLIGSEVIFQDGRDPSDRSRRFVVPLTTTSDRISFNKVKLEPKEPDVVGGNGSGEDGGEGNRNKTPPPVLFAGRRKRAPGLVSGKKGKGKEKEKQQSEGSEDDYDGGKVDKSTARGRGRGRGRGNAARGRGRGNGRGRGRKSKATEVAEPQVQSENSDGSDGEEETGEAGPSMGLAGLENLESMDVDLSS